MNSNTTKKHNFFVITGVLMPGFLFVKLKNELRKH